MSVFFSRVQGPLFAESCVSFFFILLFTYFHVFFVCVFTDSQPSCFRHSQGFIFVSTRLRLEPAVFTRSFSCRALASCFVRASVDTFCSDAPNLHAVSFSKSSFANFPGTIARAGRRDAGRPRRGSQLHTLLSYCTVEELFQSRAAEGAATAGVPRASLLLLLLLLDASGRPFGTPP